MASLVLQAAGYAIGNAILPGIGGTIGSAIGGALGGMLSKPDKQRNVQPVQDLKVMGTDYGQAHAYGRGTILTGGQIVWNSDKILTQTTTSSGGGKGIGGGAPASESTTNSYTINLLIVLTDIEGAGILRVFDNGALIYNIDNATDETPQWDRMTFYSGASDQMPDPTYEAAVGTANAPAYRGRSSVFIEGLKLGTSGQMRNLTFEVVIDGISDTALTYFNGYPSNFATDEHYEPNSVVHLPALGELWVPDVEYGPGASDNDRIAIYTKATDSWSHINLNKRLLTYSGTPTAFLLAVPEWDRVYVAVVAPGGIYSTQIYQASTRTLLEDTYDTLGSGRVIHGIDVSRERCLMSNLTVEFQVRNMSSGSPTTVRGTCSFTDYGSGGAGGPPVVDADGNYWLQRSVGSGAWTKITTDGARSDISASPDGVYVQAFTYTYIDTDNAIYFWSNLYPSSEYLKKIDCSTETISRVSATPYSVSLEPSYGDMVYAPNLQQLIATRGGPAIGAGKIFLINPADGVIEQEYDGGYMQGGIAYATGYMWALSFNNTPMQGIAEFRFEGVLSDPPTVQEVVSDLCVRAGLTTDQIDVSALSSITRKVKCLPVSQIVSTRTVLELLASIYFFEMTCADKLKFVPRGGSSIVTIPYADLGAAVVGNESPEPLALTELNDLEIPAQLALTYQNLDADYQPDTQYSDRLISTTSTTVETREVAIGLTPSEAKAIVDTWLMDMIASRFSTTISLLGHYQKIEPIDPITVTASDGSLFRMRTRKLTDSFPVLTLEAVTDDTSILSQLGITSADYTSSTSVAAVVGTLREFIDWPIFQDADDDGGFYVAAHGDDTPWPGGAIYDSSNDVDFTLRATITESAVYGTCTTTLGDWTGPRVIDEINTVTVNVGAGTLASSTRDAVLNDHSVNAWIIGNEFIQAINETLVSPGTYTLSRLLRGGRGTEWAMTGHGSSERCVLIRPEGIRRITLSTAQIGIARYYKAVTLGRAVATATSATFTGNAVGLKPFAPFDLRATRDGSNNVTLTWQRRSRLATRTIGLLGIYVPLGEASEAYEVDIYDDGTYTTVVRTISATTTSASYSAAEQTSDGLTPGDPIYARVYQRSAVVGRGYELEQAA